MLHIPIKFYVKLSLLFALPSIIIRNCYDHKQAMFWLWSLFRMIITFIIRFREFVFQMMEKMFSSSNQRINALFIWRLISFQFHFNDEYVENIIIKTKLVYKTNKSSDIFVFLTCKGLSIKSFQNEYKTVIIFRTLTDNLHTCIAIFEKVDIWI